MASSEEQIVIQEIRKGNIKVFEAFFQKHYSALCAYSKMVVTRSDVAEDIVQDLFCSIWNKKEEFTINTSVKAYLFRSVYNNSIEFINSVKRENSYKEFNAYDLQNSEDEAINPKKLAALNKAIDALPEKCKEVFKLKKIYNLTHAEIADQLSISTKTVETQMYRANKVLKEKLRNMTFIQLLILFSNSL